MAYIHGFPPIESSTARVLILGSVPGIRSLREGQYYAHPRNVFWNILGKLLSFDPACAYERRIAAVLAADIAIWDVLKACTRASSLDSDIDESSIVPNDFRVFFAKHPNIRRICFNGAKAEMSYMKIVLPRVTGHKDMEYVRLPSTSPAFAAMSLARKEQAWNAILSWRGSATS